MKEWSYTLAYDIGDKVRYKNKIGRDEGYVTGIHIRGNGSVTYSIVWSDKMESTHWDFELELMD